MTNHQLRELMEQAGADVASLAFRLNVKPAFMQHLVDGIENIDSDRAEKLRAALLLSIRRREGAQLAKLAKADRKARLEQWFSDVERAAAEHLANGHPIAPLLASIRLTLERIETRLDKLEVLARPAPPPPPDTGARLLLSTDDVVRILGSTTERVRALVKAGRLHPVPPSGIEKRRGVRFHRSEVEALLAELVAPPKPTESGDAPATV